MDLRFLLVALAALFPLACGRGFLNSNVENRLVWFSAGNKATSRRWVSEADRYLAENTRPRPSNMDKCDAAHPPQSGKVCDVDLTQMFPCMGVNSFNFHRGGPCILIKPNKIYGWQPDFYNDSKTLPQEMPELLRKRITLREKAFGKSSLNKVWVSCEGVHPVDVEHVGPFELLPDYGFEGHYFPFNDSEGYRSPVIAAYFAKPTRGVIINIVCKAWAYNLHNNCDSMHFQLMVDD